MSRSYIILALTALSLAAPAAAQTPPGAQAAPAASPAPPARRATRIPEPDTIALFVLGGAGLVIGRRLSRTRRTRQPDA